MADKCPRCSKDLLCLGGCSAHPDNWYCSDEKGCGYQAWNPQAGAAVMRKITGGDVVIALKALKRSVSVEEISVQMGGVNTRAIATAARKPTSDGRITMHYPKRGSAALYRFVRLHAKGGEQS
jgi:hypothetical protein